MQKTLISNLMACIVTLASLSGCNKLGEKSAEMKSEEAMVASSRKFIQQGQFAQAADELQLLVDHYPTSNNDKVHLQELMHAELKSKEYLNASETAQRYLDVYAHEKNADYALYVQGKSLFEMTQPHWFAKRVVRTNDWGDIESLVTARNAFVELVDRFPDSRYIQEAYKGIEAIDEQIAVRNFGIAQHYHKKKAFAASQARLNEALLLTKDDELKRSVQRLIDENTKRLK